MIGEAAAFAETVTPAKRPVAAISPRGRPGFVPIMFVIG
jgi:hypothetical protein